MISDTKPQGVPRALESQSNVQATDPNTNLELLADLKGALDTGNWTDSSPDQTSPPVPNSNDGGTIQEPVVTTATPPVVDNPQGPTQDGPVGISYVPENLQSEFTTLTPNLQQWVKDGTMMRDRFTQGTQKLADDRKAMEAEVEGLKRDAYALRNLRQDTELCGVMKDFLDKRIANPTVSTPSTDEEEVDLLSLSPVELKEYNKRQRERIKSEVMQELHQRYIAPVEAKNQLQLLLINEFVTSRGIPAIQVEQAAAMAADHARTYKIAVTPENVVGLVDLFINKVSNKSTAAAPTGRASGEGSSPVRVATPPSGGGIPPLPSPAYAREGRKPTSSNDFHKAVLHGLSAELGTEVTNQDLRDILFGPNK